MRDGVGLLEALMIAALVVGGGVAVFALCRIEGVQSIAALISIVSLLFVAVLCYVFVVMLGWYWIVPIFFAAGVILPLGLYYRKVEKTYEEIGEVRIWRGLSVADPGDAVAEEGGDFGNPLVEAPSGIMVPASGQQPPSARGNGPSRPERGAGPSGRFGGIATHSATSSKQPISWLVVDARDSRPPASVRAGCLGLAEEARRNGANSAAVRLYYDAAMSSADPYSFCAALFGIVLCYGKMDREREALAVARILQGAAVDLSAAKSALTQVAAST